MDIRKEQNCDIQGIYDVTKAAFENHPHSNQTEPDIIDSLRESGALAVSLVATISDEIVGHIAFSPVSINKANLGWYGLGPVSVMPTRQKQGIGAKLIETGLHHLKGLKASGCVLLGDPNYYRRFGFACDENLTYPGVPPEYFQCLSFGAPIPQGKVTYHSAFNEA